MPDTVTTTETTVTTAPGAVTTISATSEGEREEMDEDLKNVTDAENWENNADAHWKNGRPLDALQNIVEALKSLAKVQNVTDHDVSGARERLKDLNATIIRHLNATILKTS